MPVISVYKLDKSYGSSRIFSDVTFNVDRGQKIALVGPNGGGKTTLLRILAGEEAPDGGEVRLGDGVNIGYLAQDTSAYGSETIEEYIKIVSGYTLAEEGLEDTDDGYAEFEERYGYDFEHKMETILSGFGINGLHQPMVSLSSGQKSKLFELDAAKGCLNISGGTYSDYIEMRQKARMKHESEYESQQSELSRLQKQSQKRKDQSERGSQFQGKDKDKLQRDFKRDRAGRSGKHAKTLDKRMDMMEMVDRPPEIRTFTIPLDAKIGSGNVKDHDIVLEHVVCGYMQPVGTDSPADANSGGNVLVRELDMEISFGERIVILGGNGMGKSTLFKTITGTIPPLEGRVKIGKGVIVGNLMQEHESMPSDMCAADYLSSQVGDMPQVTAVGRLINFGFHRTQALRPIHTLNPGARVRCLLCLFSIKLVNVLILDEPTNHLDIEAIEALEISLATYKGTVLIITHDLHFITNVRPDKMMLLENGDLTSISDLEAYIEESNDRANRLVGLLDY